MGWAAGMAGPVGVGLKPVGNSPITLRLKARALWWPVGGLESRRLVVAGAAGVWLAGA